MTLYSSLEGELQMLRIVKTILWILAAYKWGHWRDWRKYYATLLFGITGDLIYFVLSYNHPLWELVSPIMNITFNHILVDLLSFPAIGLLFLSKYREEKPWLKRGLFNFMGCRISNY